ncbi:hypothetical protein [Geomonas sp.]|uniref:hypothetical protein n=1 Tax=Geomonas sp. TaxID=2651584 RepID=UPI002B48428A|nr:hypothetical protein [Geomonas sp.]HJV36073.1 hypothetical protein [Geomonas sp.]
MGIIATMTIAPAPLIELARRFALGTVDAIVNFKRWTEKLLLPHEGRVKPEGAIAQAALCARFPRYLQGGPGHVRCGRGWYPLVWDLCTAVEAMEHLGMPKVGYVQAEQRLGGLFLKVDSPSLLVREVAREVEHKAAATCEECGAPGSLRLGHGFAKTLCPAHAKVRKRVRHPRMCLAASQPAPKLLFLDAEFTDLDYPQLISIALVAESGETFYAELADGWSPQGCSDFVAETVLPQLTGGDFMQERLYAERRLAGWLADFCCPVRVVSDAPRYDWVLLKDLLGNSKPVNLLHEPLPLFSESFPELVPLLQEAKAGAFRDLTRHHALNDAVALREAWEVMRINVHPAILDQYLRHS